MTVNPVGDLDGEIVTARVDRGVLAILLESSGEVVENLLSARIAWLIDTGDPNG